MTATLPAAGSVQAHIRSLVPALAPAERRVAEAILADPALVLETSITDIAALCHTSETTVVRFCRTAQFRGYPGLRLALATELGRDLARHGTDTRELGADLTREDSLEQVVRKIAYADVHAIEETTASIDFAALEQVVEAVRKARRIVVFGLGGSALAARDFHQKLIRIGRDVVVADDPHIALLSAALLRSDDVALAISHTGETAEVLEWVSEAAAHDATTVAITNHPYSALGEAVDHVLVTAAREGKFRAGAMSSRIAQLVLTDCIFLGVVQRSYDSSLEALTATLDAVERRRPPARRHR
jgi:DNA-binding MurR/RpiR family transcriptional regulator